MDIRPKSTICFSLGASAVLFRSSNPVDGLNGMRVKPKISNGAEAASDLKAVGRRLRELRGFDMTQEEFAKRLGISQSQLSKYERGLAAPAADVLVRIKQRFRVNIDWLLTGEK